MALMADEEKTFTPELVARSSLRNRGFPNRVFDPHRLHQREHRWKEGTALHGTLGAGVAGERKDR